MKSAIFPEFEGLTEFKTNPPVVEVPHTVQVRVTTGGHSLNGWVVLSLNGPLRLSELLNTEDRYLTIHREPFSGGQATDATVVSKDAISYVEVIGESKASHWVVPGTFEPVVIELRSPEVVLHGELFVTPSSSVTDVLNDGRRFMSVRNAQFVDERAAHAFLAVGKQQTTIVHF